jgi:hypothetical protein
MADEYLRLGDMPREFQEILAREFVPYSVGMAWVSSQAKHTFAPFGSGTLVKKNGHTGVLTARHCVKQMRHTSAGYDTVVLVLRDARAVYLAPDSLFEHKLTIPLTAEYGPDLDFLEIAPCEQRQTISAVASIWSLDREIDALLTNFATEGSLLVSGGFPEERCKTTPISGGFRRVAYHLAYSNVIQKGDIIEKDGWDYIQSTCFYCDENDLPQSFGGTSGGGIWGVQVHRNEDTGKFSIGKSALVGVSFYQTERENNLRYVRGHFIKSIYDKAWRNFVDGK